MAEEACYSSATEVLHGVARGPGRRTSSRVQGLPAPPLLAALVLHVFRPDPAPVTRTITAVAGIQVGHAVLEGGGSGYTVVLGPFIVPGAVIHDLVPGAPRPGPREGRAACDAASAARRVGAGAGATVGKLGGPNGTFPGGVGSGVMRVGRYHVGALAVVNAIRDVDGERGPPEGRSPASSSSRGRRCGPSSTWTTGRSAR